MPIVLPQNMKTISTLNAQPERMTSKIHLLVMMDIAGATGNQMSEHSGLTASRVSIIRNSPMFTQERNRKMNELQERIIDKKSSSIAEGDPIDIRLKQLASDAVETYANILSNSKGSESVKKVAADSILDRAGYKAHTEKMKVSIEVTEKMASRFEEVLAYNTDKEETRVVSALSRDITGEKVDVRPGKNDRKTTVSVETEMSE